MTSTEEENRRYDELNKKLNEALTKIPHQTEDIFTTSIKKMKSQAIDNMDAALKRGDLPSALFFRTQVQSCKLMLREYF
jgi:hypothetical protein